MRILATVMKSYYGQPDAIEPMFRQFTEAPRRLGHEVDHFDHARTRREVGFDLCGERFVETVQQGRYDMVIFQTTGQDQMPLTAIQQAGRYAPVVAWNSDDDWQWASLSRPRAPYFTYMVTTYPDVYEANRSAHPNLLLSQWACLDLGADPSRPKDLDFTFAGQLYGERISECRHLRRHAGLQVFGRGARLVERPWLAWLPLRAPLHVLGLYERLRGPALLLTEVYDVWNRSKISFTPMASSADPKLLQIKGRAFEQGLSGTLMLAQNSPNLDRYYEPGKEFVPFSDMADCTEKARFYLTHDAERERIVEAYLRRTRAEHMWEHRFQDLFRQLGLPPLSRQAAGA